MRRKFKTHLKLKDSAPLILTGLSMCGVIFTAAAAIHDTPKALKLIKHEEDHRMFKMKVYSTGDGKFDTEVKVEPMTLLEKAKIAWKCYIPTMLVAGSTIFCIGYSQKLNSKQKKELLAAYALMHAAYYEYRDKVSDIFGPDADGKIKEFISEDRAKTGKVEYGNGKKEDSIIFVDEFMNTVFESSVEEVQRAEYELNRTFALRGYVSMGDFYRYLGLDDVYAEDGPLLERFGWSYDIGTDMGYEWIDFAHKKIEDADMETYSISYPFEPVLGYLY